MVGDICDRQLVTNLLSMYKPMAVVHFAAESHVDRSIHSPLDFVKTNVDGTLTYWKLPIAVDLVHAKRTRPISLHTHFHRRGLWQPKFP